MDRKFVYALALLGANACGSDGSSPEGQGSAGSAAAGSSGGGTPVAGAAAVGGGVSGRSGQPGAGGNAAAGNAAAGNAAAGNAAAGGGGGGSGVAGGPAAAGGGAGAAAGAAAMPAGPTECHGMTIPPRAIKKPGPFAVGPETAGLPAYWPTEGWRTELPDKLGFDPQKLAMALEFDTPNANTQAIFVVRHGYVAIEKYLGSFTATSPHESYSMAKSFTSGLIGMLIAEGKLPSTDAKICQYYPMEWDCADSSDPRSRITVDHAMNLTTGLRWTEDWRSGATGTNDAVNLNMLDTALARETVAEPGTMKRYSTGDPALLSGVIEQAAGMSPYQYAKEKLFDVIGIPNVRWGMDSRGRTTVYAGLQATASEFAKYGYLVLNGGKWDGKQVIPAEWIAKTTQSTMPCDDWNQWLWHVNLPLRLGKQDPSCVGSGKAFCTPTDIADVPADGFTAKGVNGQYILVIPSLDLVVVRLASDMPGSEKWDEYARGLILGILDAMK